MSQPTNGSSIEITASLGRIVYCYSAITEKDKSEKVVFPNKMPLQLRGLFAIDALKLNVKDKCCSCWDRSWETAVTVGEITCDG